MQGVDFVELFVDIFCGEIMVYLSILLLFFQKLRPLTSASRTSTKFDECLSTSLLSLQIATK